MTAVRLSTLLAVLLLANPLAAQEDLTVLPGDKNASPRKMLSRYLLAEAQKHFDARRQVVATLKTPQDVQRRQLELKLRFIQALGGFPAKTPLNARVVGVGALLVGGNTATFRIWDGIRSLDYLASRPEIDAKRLGCTGCSGGGTLTSYLMALDERIVAAAPSCYITSLERLFATIGPQDAEQNITGQVAFGMEHADYLLLHAPRPALLLTGTRDFF